MRHFVLCTHAAGGYLEGALVLALLVVDLGQVVEVCPPTLAWSEVRACNTRITPAFRQNPNSGRISESITYTDLIFPFPERLGLCAPSRWRGAPSPHPNSGIAAGGDYTPHPDVRRRGS